MDKKIFIYISGLFLAIPLLAGAVKDLNQIILDIINLVKNAALLFMVLAVAVFLWGIVKYIMAAGSEDKAKEAKGYIIYGLIGIFVMVSFVGIIEIFTNFFDITPGAGIGIPKEGVPTIDATRGAP